MAQYYDMTAANAALKELYDGQTVQFLSYKKNRFLALVPKDTEFGGKYKPVPIITAPSGGRSSTFANAQANQTPPQVESFLLTSKSDYALGTIDNRTMLSARTDAMAFLRDAKVVVDGAVRKATLSLASSLWRGGTGTIAQVSTATSISTGVITLQNAADVVQFEVNDVVQAAATDGGTPRSALGYIISIDRALGTITVASSGFGGAAATPTSWTTSDYLLIQGDSNLKLSGVPAWILSSAPATTDNFYGVNRSADRVRLAGVYYDASKQSIEEGLIDASMLAGREEGSPDYFFCNYTSYGALDKALGAKVNYVDLKTGEIGFRGIRVNGADGEIMVVADRNVPSATGYLLQMDTWKLDTLNEAPHIFRYNDGLEMLRVYNADAAELRVGYYGNLECNAPGWNTAMALPI